MQYLIVRHMSTPTKVAAHKRLRWIIPSGEAFTEEQARLTYGAPLAAVGNTRAPYCRYITDDGQLFADAGSTYICEVTDKAPKPTKARTKVDETLAIPTAAFDLYSRVINTTTVSTRATTTSMWAYDTTAADTEDVTFR